MLTLAPLDVKRRVPPAAFLDSHRRNYLEPKPGFGRDAAFACGDEPLPATMHASRSIHAGSSVSGQDSPTTRRYGSACLTITEAPASPWTRKIRLRLPSPISSARFAP